MTVSGSWNVKNMIYNIRIVKIKDLQVAVRISRILQKLWPWTNKNFWRFALSRDHKCLPKLHLIKSRLFQGQVKVSHSRALELHFKWTCTIYLKMTWGVKLSHDTWSMFLLAIPSVDPWIVKCGVRYSSKQALCKTFFGQRGGSVFVQDFSRGSITPKNSQKYQLLKMSLFWVQDTKDHFYVIKHHNHKFKLTQYFVDPSTVHPILWFKSWTMCLATMKSG